jgi:hypothetical protein
MNHFIKFIIWSIVVIGTTVYDKLESITVE